MKTQKSDIEEAFKKACDLANSTTKKFPPDIMLQFYAYYKQATDQNGNYNPTSTDNDVRSAFKLNAMLQVKGLSALQAKREYIALVKKYISTTKEL